MEKQGKITDFFKKNQKRNSSKQKDKLEENKEQNQLIITNQLLDYAKILDEAGFYVYGEELELREQQTKKPYQFQDQASYDFVCNLIIGYVQQLMIEKYNMTQLWIPEDAKGEKCNIFISNDFYKNQQKCLILIQGTGQVRAGIWSRRVCIQENLKMGSMLPMIEFCQNNGFSCIVMNPNEHTKYFESMSDHCKYVWKKYILPNKVKKLAIVAHSAGGRCVADLFREFRSDFKKKVQQLIFTDSYYHSMFEDMTNAEKQLMAKIGIHYKTFQKIQKPLGEPFKKQIGSIQEVSAGTDQHEKATGCALELILTRLKNM